MEPDDWKRVKETYAGALDRPRAERDAFVRAASGDDRELRRDVLELLASNDDAGPAFLGNTAVGEALDLLAAARSSARVGQRIGPWQILREIGHGGMGTVYQAERVEGEFVQRVAIKVMRGGVDGAAPAGAELARRFRDERRILARLDHPHIARLLDGGATDDGLLYFVMEHVEGVAIDRYCDAHGLSIDRRIDLFLTVCEAVQHAHRNLVIHRDVKPSNILVTADGTPKLLDFGIAKLVRPEDGGDPTRTALPVMTPGYASPEQIHNRPVTTASEVFSLGVLLYELLTGEKPYPVESGSLPELAQRMAAGPPTRPSSAASAGSPRRRRRLRGDLDAIVLKALRSEPEQRYPSVEAFTQDLRHERRGLPVAARRGTVSYLAGKFVRRYRLAVAATALIVLSLTGGILTTLWQARTAEAARQRAERRFDDVRHLAHALLFDYHDAIAALPGSTAARKLLVDDALEYLDGLAREAAGDGDLRRELASAYERVGDIQGRPDAANLGDLDAALASYRRALALRRELAGEVGDRALDAAIATNLHRIGDVLWWNGDTRGALEHFAESRDLRLALVGEAPESRDLRLALASSYEALGDVEMWNGEPRAARRKFERALAVLQEIAAAGEDDELRRRLGECVRRLGEADGWAGDIAGAVERIGESAAILEPLAARRPTDAEIGYSLVVSHLRLAENQAELPGASALGTYLKALERIAALSAADPNNARAKRLVAVIRSRVGDTLLRAGDPERALPHYLAAVETWDALIAEYPTNASHRRDRAVAHRRLGDAHLAAGRPDTAALDYERSLEHLRELAERDPDDTALLRDSALSHHALGDALTRLADAAGDGERISLLRAREHYRQALDILTELDARGALAGYDRGEVDKLVEKIELCDRRLGLGMSKDSAPVKIF